MKAATSGVSMKLSIPSKSIIFIPRSEENPPRGEGPTIMQMA